MVFTQMLSKNTETQGTVQKRQGTQTSRKVKGRSVNTWRTKWVEYNADEGGAENDKGGEGQRQEVKQPKMHK